MPKGISRDRIVAEALSLLDEEGIDGFTARTLARRLDVQAPALYWHFTNKRELLDAMGTEISRRVAAAMEAEGDASDWRAGLAGWARLLRREFLRHRDSARTFGGIRVADPAVLRTQELWLGRWLDTGLTLEQLARAAQLVQVFVVGFVIEEEVRAEPPLVATDDLPLLAAVRPGLSTRNDERFELYLDMLLTGVASHYAD